MKRISWLFFLSAVAFAQEHTGAPAPEGGDSLDMWRWINFGLLAIGLGYLLVKNLPVFFRTRSASIQKEISEAQQHKRESDQRAAEIERKVSNLSAEIDAFRKQSRAEMEREGERIRIETAAAIDKVNQQAQLEIESATKLARREVRLYAADLALDLAAQRVRARLDDGTEAALVDNFIVDLKSQESQN